MVPETVQTPLPLLESTVKTMDDPAPPADDVPVNVNGEPTRPVPGPLKEMAWEPSAVAIERSVVAKVPLPLLACTMKEDDPAAVGVPERTPAEDRVSPAGNEPENSV